MNYSGKNNYKDFLEFLHVNYEGIQEYEVFTNDLSVLSYLGEEENQLIFAMINGKMFLMNNAVFMECEFQ